MELSWPIKLDHPVYVREGGRLEKLRYLQRSHLGYTFTLLDAQGQPTLAEGRDSSPANGGKGVRLTRLVGVQPGFLLKSCPRCETVKPHQAFGLRVAGGVVRDQSYCQDCR
ncbi:MAG: hypothetical protein H6739_27920 [Alphaproteobacteria bacterium]|nr:hypothetical protein [Alphaproteobacteria bacterium]